MQIREKLLEHYKESYYFELDRKDKISSNLNLPITILVLVAGVLSYYLNNLPNLDFSLKSAFLCFLLFSLFVSICFSFYYLYRCLTNYTYGYVSSTEEIDKYINQIHEYNTQVDENRKIDTEDEFVDFLIEQYSKCASMNSQNNKRKTGYLRSTSVSLLIAVIIMTVSAFPFFILKYNSSSQVQKVEITNLKEITMAENKDKPDPKPQGQDKPNPTPPKPEPPKPVRPQIQTVQESLEKKPPQVITEEKPKPKK